MPFDGTNFDGLKSILALMAMGGLTGAKGKKKAVPGAESIPGESLEGIDPSITGDLPGTFAELIKKQQMEEIMRQQGISAPMTGMNFGPTNYSGGL